MSTTLYAVIATLPSEEVGREYIAWLEEGHVDQVIEGGAQSAMIVELEPDATEVLAPGAMQVMTQYVFSTRSAFDRYVERSAPKLRAEGLAKFGPERGIKMRRMVGRVA